ncbi:MAG TPA: FecR family protein [Bryobacteraceae bacterium]|nr:FecR family protein [Bryobacteraceae bacterium]
MRHLLWMLVPAAMFAGQARYARLGDFDGKVEVQLQAADPWMAAERNLPLPELAWLRTGPDSRVEIELDEGSAWRLGADSQGEISDDSQLSTGQRVTLLSLDHGVAYFTGRAAGNDSLSLAVPGGQVIFHQGARVRLEAGDQWSQVSVIEGTVRFSSPAAEMDLHDGQVIRVEPARTERFFLYRQIAPLPLDRWSEARDKALEAPVSSSHVPEHYGLADLDANGEWVQTQDLGAVWKPKTADGWVPYRSGRWRWYEPLGYTWVSDETWGWLPYHYGRWTREDSIGWVWAPSKSEVFMPGEVYWLRGAKLAGWGPLAPNEQWTPAALPQQFLNANTTYATFQQDARVIDPAGFTGRPKEPLGVAVFTQALPSPAFAAARLDATRPVLRAGSTRVTPVLAGVTFQEETDVEQPPPQNVNGPAIPVAAVANPGTDGSPVIILSTPPPPEEPPVPEETFYPVPVYTGVIVVNPPEAGTAPPRRPHRRPPPQTPPPQTPPAMTPPPPPAAAPGPPSRPQPPIRNAFRPIQRGPEVRQERPLATPRNPQAAPPAKSSDAPSGKAAAPAAESRPVPRGASQHQDQSNSRKQ